jgi:hypothetical protein
MAEIPAILILAGLAAYSILAGADFGAGLWTLLARPGRMSAEATREHARHAMGPVWEANHVWLIFVLVVLWTAFSEVFGSIFSTLFVPLCLAALGIVLRGSGFAFQRTARTERGRSVAERLFGLSSLLTPFFMGTVVGAIATGRVPVGNAKGDPVTSWLNPTSIAIGVLAVATGAYLAAVYLSADARRLGSAELEDAFRRRALAAGVDIITGARVHSAQRLGSGWEIGAGQEGFSAGVLVNAAGAWADELAVLSGVEKIGLQPYRRTAAIASVDRPLPEGSPMVAAADDSFYFRREGSDVLISPSEHVPSAAEDARPRPGDVERLIARLNSLTTLGISTVRTAWTGLRTEAADGVPVVGFDAEARGFFWLAGQGGYGFQTSSGIAELAAALILAGAEAGTGAEGRTGDEAGTEPDAGSGPVSRTADALAATRWSIRR